MKWFCFQLTFMISWPYPLNLMGHLPDLIAISPSSRLWIKTGVTRRSGWKSNRSSGVTSRSCWRRNRGSDVTSRSTSEVLDLFPPAELDIHQLVIRQCNGAPKIFDEEDHVSGSEILKGVGLKWTRSNLGQTPVGPSWAASITCTRW